MVFVLLAILLELVFVLAVFLYFNEHAQWINIVTRIAAVIIVLGVYSQHRSASVKMPQIILVLAAPVLGVALYLLIGLNGFTRRKRKRYEAVDEELLPLLPENGNIPEKLKASHPGAGNLSAYIKQFSGYLVFRDTASPTTTRPATAWRRRCCSVSPVHRFRADQRLQVTGA